MEYDKKESHVRVVISDNLEKEIQQKYPQHILSFFFFVICRWGKCEWDSEWYGMVRDGPEWAAGTRPKKAARANTPRKCRKVCGDKPATRQRF